MTRTLRTAAIVTASIWAGGILSSTAAVEAAEPGQRWALLIGVNDYVELKNLQYCQRDAEALRDTLVSAGFAKKNVFLIASGAGEAAEQPFKANIERQLKVVLGLAEAGDMVLVCFSGHGIHVDGKTFLCPSEADDNDPSSTMIGLNWVYQQLSDCRASQKMFWVDACRNDPRRSGSRTAHSKDLESIGRELARPPEGVLVLASCKEGQQSWEDDDLRHGVFMHYLLEGLSGKADRESGDRNDQVSLLELYKYANVNTKRAVANRQRELQTPELFGRITGDFDIAEVRTELPEEFTNSVGMKLKLIPAGEFLMGSPEDEEDRGNDEGPRHRVRITRPFYLGVYEVTQSEYEQVMGEDPSRFKGPKRPVENVSWDDAVEFCRRLSEKEGKRYRLPTEAEWEYACRAGTTTPFNFGSILNGEQANCDGNYPYGTEEKGPYKKETTEVGTYRANAWGLYDMHGNAWEWCQDWYDSSYYANSPENDPTGPTSGSTRVNRGGSWCSCPGDCRSAFRYWFTPVFRYSLGFRVAQVPVD